MKAKVIETGEIVNVTPNPTWYKENGQGPNRREWDEDELEFIYSNKKEENFDLQKEIYEAEKRFGDIDEMGGYKILMFDDEFRDLLRHFYELGLKKKGE